MSIKNAKYWKRIFVWLMHTFAAKKSKTEKNSSQLNNRICVHFIKSYDILTLRI